MTNDETTRTRGPIKNDPASVRRRISLALSKLTGKGDRTEALNLAATSSGISVAEAVRTISLNLERLDPPESKGALLGLIEQEIECDLL